MLNQNIDLFYKTCMPSSVFWLTTFLGEHYYSFYSSKGQNQCTMYNINMYSFIVGGSVRSVVG
jgi:hypothetical protein